MLTIDFSKIDFYQVIKDNYNDERIQQVLESLPPDEREVLEYRIGINQEKMTRPQIAVIMSTTIEKTRGREERALKRIKHPARIQMINAVLDPNFQISDRVKDFYNQLNKKM